jgi:hypothetical protein
MDDDRSLVKAKGNVNQIESLRTLYLRLGLSKLVISLCGKAPVCVPATSGEGQFDSADRSTFSRF